MSKSTPKVAIITRTLGRNNVLHRALQSVDNQTYTDYVHVVINDGGDKSELDGLLAKYPSSKRKVLHLDKSIGGTPALNRGIREVDSAYIAILDDDDSWSDDRLQVAVEYMDQHGSLGTVSVMDRLEESIDDNGVIHEVSRNRWRPDITTIKLYEQCLENHLSNGCFMYRRSVYDELGGYDESLEVAEDWEFGLRFLRKYDIDFIETDHALVNYHLRPKVSGMMGNSVFDGVKKHEKAITKILNRYLREDLERGALGIGYIMNDLKFTQKHKAIDVERSTAEAIENVVRLEGHINRAEESISTAIGNQPKPTHHVIAEKLKGLRQ